MAYNEKLSDRIREALIDVPLIEEKRMFGGACYMVDGKMCIGVVKNEIMCRIGPDIYQEALEKRGCREMDFAGKPHGRLCICKR
jgi:TfoX/Sxy family transcriptional regulator of competence genes